MANGRRSDPRRQATEDRRGSAGERSGFPHGSGRFRLLRYFTLATLVAFTAVGAALIVLQENEEAFFEASQTSQQRSFVAAQARLAKEQEEAARASLLTVHEAGHVMLTRVVANMLWESDIAPLLIRARQLPVEHCRLLPKDARTESGTNPRKECFAAVGRLILNLPGFASFDKKAFAAMRSTRVFKIKVWDLRGIAIYSSEHGQIGDDGSANLGWQSAVAGKPASELTHRERFSAFEGVVENRDLISTYVPVRDADQGEVVGVFELYSDVTPFLEQSRAASERFTALAATHQDNIENAGRANLEQLRSGSARFLLIIGGLLAFLYAVSLLIVRFGQRIIDRQAAEREQAVQREELWHREKMTALSTMVANVAHEVGNPLAIIAGLAQNIGSTAASSGAGRMEPTSQIMEQTDRIARMMRQMGDFTSARSDGPEYVDATAMLKAICEFLSYDPRFKNVSIEFAPAASLPAVKVVPDYLNEVMMNVLQGCVAALPNDSRRSRLQVCAEVSGADFRIVVHCDGGLAMKATAGAMTEAGIGQAIRRIDAMGGSVAVGADAVEIRLPQAAATP